MINEGIMKKGTYNKADVDNIVIEYKKEVNELSRQSDLKDTIINDIGKDYRSISDKWIMSKAERLEKENVELERENKYLKIILNIYEKALKNLKELLLNVPIINKMLNNKQELDIKEQTLTGYLKSQDVEELEVINKQYHQENEEYQEYEMGE